MPFVEPEHPFAQPPRVPKRKELPDWDGSLQVSDGYAVLRQVHIANPLPLDGCHELELIDCNLSSVSFAEAPGIELEVQGCHFDTCDLGQVTSRTLTRSSFAGCKFIGADLSGSKVEDVRFSNGLFRYSNLRMAKYSRVEFGNCQLVEADFYDSTLTNISFDHSELIEVVFDKCKLERVDLRQAKSVALTSVGDLSGALISNQQVMELAHLFALASGIGIERD